MASLLEQLTGQLSGNALSQIASQIGADESATSSAIAGALPVILGGLMKNAQSSDGASALGAALDRDHDGSVLDDLGGFLGQTQQLERHGGGILGHVFGGQTGRVAESVGRTSGLDAGSAGQLMKILAPMVMAQLGKEKRRSNLDTSGLSDLLRTERRELQSRPEMGMFTKMLDQDGDGSAFDDLAKAGAGLLGNMLRRR